MLCGLNFLNTFKNCSDLIFIQSKKSRIFLFVDFLLSDFSLIVRFTLLSIILAGCIISYIAYRLFEEPVSELKSQITSWRMTLHTQRINHRCFHRSVITTIAILSEECRLDFRRLPGPVFDPPRRETARLVTRWPCLWRNWKTDYLRVSDVTRAGRREPWGRGCASSRSFGAMSAGSFSRTAAGKRA